MPEDLVGEVAVCCPLLHRLTLALRESSEERTQMEILRLQQIEAVADAVASREKTG
jgi:hypothetical protein